MKIHLKMSQKSFTFFKSYVGLLTVINEEMTMKVDDTGITARGMDPSHVAMIDSKLKPGLFEEFTSMEDGGSITINLAEFNKFLERIERDEVVNIDYDVEKARLIIKTSTSGRNRRFSLPVLEPYDDETPQPKIFFKSEARILTQSMDRAIKDAGLVSEHARVSIAETLKIEAQGDIGEASNEYTKDSEEILDIKSEEASEATYTLSYLADMFGKIKGMADVITLHLSTDMPLKIQVEPDNPNLEVTLYLAPVIGA